jgi:serine phosphatase RsbU (regulator of sigma subunit)
VQPQRAFLRLIDDIRSAARSGSDPALRPVASDDTELGGPIVQQVLDSLPGAHSWLVPVRDDAGEVTDYLTQAASPEAVDVVGRRGAAFIGVSIRDSYPSVVDGPLWQAYRDVLEDGTPREIGPFTYIDGGEGIPAESVYSVRAYRLGTGLMISWTRHDEESRHTERIAQTERLGNLGWGEWDLITGQILWSDQLYLIFERDPAAGPLSNEEVAALTLPEDEPLRRQAGETLEEGATIDAVYRIQVAGKVKHIRVIADALRDATGRPLRIYGIIQDVTARESARARLAQVERQLREHQRSLAAEHQLAAELQHIILPIPDTPIDLPGLRVAVRYLPAERASRVGGDWYHATTTPDGGVLLAVGDVAGHGLHAATTMAQLRYALTALTVTTTTDPAALLSQLNRLLFAGGEAAVTATAVVARYDPPTGTLTWAQAGHPPPLRSRAGQTVELSRPRGPLLGAVVDARYDNARLTIVPGDLLLFYTDGLIEHRDHPWQVGLAPVLATLNEISGKGGRQPLADLLARLRRANPDDDTCILAARPLPHPATDGEPPP